MHKAAKREDGKEKATSGGATRNVVAPPSDANAGTVLAFDFGERFIGIAVGDPAVRVAHPLAVVEARDAKARIEAIAEFIEEWRPAHLVVGLPLSDAGEPHQTGRRAQRFARQLEGRFRMKVTLIDERLSSAEAGERLRAIGRGGRKHKRLEHPVAAQVILQDYFDRHAAA